MHIELTVLEVNKVLERLVKHSQTTLAMTQMMAMKPLTDHEAVAFALEQTEEARKHIVFRGTPSFQGITDAYSLFKRAHLGSTLTLSECIAVIKIIAASHHTLAYVEDLRQEKIPTRFLDPLYQAFIPLHDLYKELTFAIDERTETLFDHASMDLQKIRKQLVSAENKLRTTMQEIMQNKASMLTDMRIVLRRDRLCLPVKVEYKNTFKGIIHDESASGTRCTLNHKLQSQ